MREAVGNLWDYRKAGCVLVITTNAETKDGKAIMGRGVAREARDRLWNIDKRIGDLLLEHGLRCFRLRMDVTEERNFEWSLISFPTKYKWRDPSDLELIRISTKQLVEMTDRFGFTEVIMVRPGTGNGKLAWEKVKPVLEEHLDDRFLVLHPEGE